MTESVRRALVVDPARFLDTPPVAPPHGWVMEFVDEIPSGAGIHAISVSPDAGWVGPDALGRLPDLQLLGATSVGTDHLDVDAAAELGIEVVNTSDYCTDEVAEHTIAFILMLLRGVVQSDREVRAGAWSVPARRPQPFSDVTLGLWGLGAIGMAVASRAMALGMDVQVCARREVDPRLGVRAVSWSDLVATSDVLSLHVPLTEETIGAIDVTALEGIRPGAYLVNMARGGVVDEAAVATALRSGRLGGAAFDVLSTEPPAADNPLLSAPNTIITPHSAWYSTRSVQRPVEQFFGALSRLHRGSEVGGETQAGGFA